MSLSLDDGVNILGVDHAQHPVAEHARCCGLHHDGDQNERPANTNLHQIYKNRIFSTTQALKPRAHKENVIMKPTDTGMYYMPIQLVIFSNVNTLIIVYSDILIAACLLTLLTVLQSSLLALHR